MRIDLVGDLKVLTNVKSPRSGKGLACFDGADIVIGNLEVPYTNRGVGQEKNKVYRAPVKALQHVADSGIHVVSLANNHMMDYGETGLADTLNAIPTYGLHSAGAGRNLTEARASVVLDVAGTRIAFISFSCTVPTGANATSYRAGVAPIRVQQSLEVDPVLMEEQPGSPPLIRTLARENDVREVLAVIAQAKRDADLVIVAAHWGLPPAYLPNNQGPLAEYQQPLAHQIVDAGADVIVGHHPHALLGVERYKDAFILYSTGNFIFHESSSNDAVDEHPRAEYGALDRVKSWYDTAVFSLHVVDGKASSLTIRPFVMDSEGNPQPLEAGRTSLEALVTHSRKLNTNCPMHEDEAGNVQFADPQF